MKEENTTNKTDITSKFLIFVTMAFVSTVGIASLYYQDSPAMWFADGSLFFTILRGAIIALLFGLLVSNPPRTILFRSVLLAGTFVLGAVAAYQLASYSMYFLDIAMCVQVGVVLAIEALEFRREPAMDFATQPTKIHVTTA